MKLFIRFTLLLIFILRASLESQSFTVEQEIIVDSDFSFEDIFLNYSVPKNIKRNLELVTIEYYSFDDKLHRGQLLIHKDLVKEIVEIFEIIKREKFPVDKVIPINHYNWSDEFSMEDNNTSAFNYRIVKGSKKLSSHALGRAIDINPKQNPHITKGKYLPVNSNYNSKAKGTLTTDSFLVKEFLKRGWKWGGHWKSSKDYQHFEKL